MSEAFDALPDTDPQQRLAFKISPQFNRKVWCPLILEQHSKTMVSNNHVETALELLPLLRIVSDDDLEGFGSIIYEALDNTPYELLFKKDVGVMYDGTPIFVDPGNIVFCDKASEKKYAKRQFTPEFQQEIMRVIDENCNRIGLPAPLRWVAKQGDLYVTRQSLLYKNPFPSIPEKKLIQLPAPEGWDL